MNSSIWLRLAALTALFCVAAPAVAQTTRTWTGAVDNRWSVAGNWSPSGTPVAGDSLEFPWGPTITNTDNDLAPGTAFTQVAVIGPGYVLNGNGIELTETWAGYGNPQVTLPIDVAGNSVTLFGSATLAGELSGTGSVLLFGSWELSGTHSYSGTMIVEDSLSLDQADLSQAAMVLQGSLTGTGTLGPVDWISGRISPVLGRIDTGHLAASSPGGMNVRIEGAIPGVSHGQLRVAGTVQLGGTLLIYFGSNWVPIVGQELVLVENDGNDSISGDFYNRPEGSIITYNGAELLVSYTGGDGNDFSLTVISAPRVWNGSVSGLWSEPGNWTPSGAPVVGDFLRFPNDAANRSTTNDLPAGSVISVVHVTGSGYRFNGNRIELSGLWASGLADTRINLPIDVAGNAVTVSGSATLAGELSGTGPMLALGSLFMSGTHSYSGDMTVQGQLHLDNADLSQAMLEVRDSLSGSGAVGQVYWGSGQISPHLRRIDAAGLSASGSGSLSIGISGTVDGVSHGQLRVAGAIDLGDSKQLSLSAAWNFVPALGHEWVLIDNDGSDPITGAFAGSSEGSIIILGGFSYQLSYVGGDGNDVSLTSLDGRLPTSTSLVSSLNPSPPGQSVTLTATVAGGAQAPSGGVIFRDGSIVLGTASLDVGGTAILGTASLEPGSRSITAEYLGGPNHGGSASAPLIQMVGDFHALTYTAGPNGSLVGESLQQVIEGGDGSEVTAVPDIGYRFVQWSDASTANPRVDTEVTESLSVEAQFAIIPDTVELQIAKDNGLQAALDGQVVVYTITAANAGPVPASGAQLSDALPAELVGGEWACLPAESNTACPPPPFDAGTGDLYAEIDLPVGGFLRYDLSARIQAGGGAVVSNTSSIVPPAGLDDLDPSNNSATDSTLVLSQGIFAHGFEAGPALLTVPAAAKAQRQASGSH